MPMDHVVFLDDDQYWPPTFLSRLLAEHKQKGMTAWWYGKRLRKSKQGVANYWKPMEEFYAVLQEKH